MRVLTVIDSLATAGAERSLADTTGPLVAAGVEMHVVPLGEREGVADLVVAGGGTVHAAVGARRAQALQPLRRVIREVRPDLVHTTLFEADLAGRLAAASLRVPVVSSLVNTAFDNGAGSPMRRRAALAADIATARTVRRFHAVSDAVARAAGARLHVDAAKIDVVHRGRSAASLGRRTAERRARVRAALGVEPATPVVLAVGRHERQKGFDVLVDAWSKVRADMPDAVLLVAGRDGPATPTLAAAVARFGGEHLRLLGTRGDVADLLAAADALALPSRWEGLPGVLIEALALEVPVVATAIDPVREVLGPDVAHALVAPESSAELAVALVAVLRGRALGQKAVAAGRARFEAAFTIERAAAGMAAFYQRALGG